MVNEKELLEEHPSLKDRFCEGFSKYDPDIWNVIQETQLEKIKVKELIKKAHQEAHECLALQEVHDWIDWFDKELFGGKNDKKEDN